MPKVSIIMPTYNRAGILPTAIKSVLSQSYQDWELLVVDNGSTDNTRSVVESIPDSRVHYIFNEHPTGSPAAPRNLGIMRAKGEYIAFLDDDDIWYPEKLSRSVRALLDSPEAILVCHARNIVQNGRIVEQKFYGPWTENMLERLLYEGNFLSLGGMTVKTDIIRQIGGFDLRKEYYGCEDYDLCIRLAYLRKPFLFIDSILDEFRITGFNESLRDPYHPVRVAGLVRDHLIQYEGSSKLSSRGRERLALAHFQAGRSLHRARKVSDALKQYWLAMQCGYPGVKGIILQILTHLA